MQSFSPALKETRQQKVASQIAGITDPAQLAAFLRRHRIPVIGTHIFADNCQPYIGNMLELLRNISLFQDTQVILLEPSRAFGALAEKTLKKGRVNPSSFSFFFSTQGFITNLSVFDIQNQASDQQLLPENEKAFQKIMSAIKRRVVFLFGLFPGRCLLHTEQDLQILANQNGIFNFEIASSPLFFVPQS